MPFNVTRSTPIHMPNETLGDILVYAEIELNAALFNAKKIRNFGFFDTLSMRGARKKKVDRFKKSTMAETETKSTIGRAQG